MSLGYDCYGLLQICAFSYGNKQLLVFVDYFTKWVVAVPLSDITAETVAKVFIEHVVLKFGSPRVVLSDQGSNFTSRLMKGVCKILGNNQAFTTPYHAMTDGRVERMNRSFQDMITPFVHDNQATWDEMIPYACFAYNSSPHSSTKHSPFELNFGREPRFPLDVGFMQEVSEHPDQTGYLESLVERLKRTLELAKSNQGNAQKQQKTQYDKGTIVPGFKVVDLVYLRKFNFGMATAKLANSKKTSLLYDGPFKIVDLPSNENAKIVHLKDNRKSQLVHRNNLKLRSQVLRDNGLRVDVSPGRIIFAKAKSDRLWWPVLVTTFDKIPTRVKIDWDGIPVEYIYGKNSPLSKTTLKKRSLVYMDMLRMLILLI